MGWTGCPSWRSKAEVVEDIERDYCRGDRLIDRSLVGNHLWILIKAETKGGDEIRLVVLYLIQCNRREWMHKAVSEDMGPTYYDCPARLIKGASAPINTYSRQWREKVARKRAEKRDRRAAQRV